MKAQIAAFPWGTPQGYPVLRLDFEGAAFDAEQADAERARISGAKGLWAVWLAGIESWDSRELDTWLGEDTNKVIAVRPIEARDWPAAACLTILDISSLADHMGSVEQLSDKVSEYASTCPTVEDVILRIGPEQRAPLAAALELLDDFVGPLGLSYLYATPGTSGWAIALRAIARAGSTWALRSLP